MVKAYLRYEPATSFGVIVSGDSNIEYDVSGAYLLAPALEKISIWNVRQGICVKSLSPSTPSLPGSSLAVTSIVSAAHPLVASGHADGSIKIWNFEKGTCETSFSGHRSAISVLRYNRSKDMLASGSKDNDITVWDMIGESGLFRLRGHRDQVTDIVFMDSGRMLVSSSKDKLLRVWDLETQHCIQIITDHHSEVWSIDIDPGERFLVSGSSDHDLKVYTISHTFKSEGANDIAFQNRREILKHFGEIQRQGKERVATVRFSKSGNLLACQEAGRTMEVYHLLDDAEAKVKAKQRVRRKAKKLLKGLTHKAENVIEEIAIDKDMTTPLVAVCDIFKLLQSFRTAKKICSMSFNPSTPKNNALAALALSLNNNMLEIYSVEPRSISKRTSIHLQGHRSDIRSLSLSSDNSLLMSTCHNAVKFWNPSTGSCLRTIDSGYGLCGFFALYNKYAFIGTKDGFFEIIDIGSGTCIERYKVHDGPIRLVAPISNSNGFVSGSADHYVKFWEYEIKDIPGQESKHLTAKEVRCMKMNDDVLAVSVSFDSRYVAVALLDCTVKVYFFDSLKLFLILYGHKLPVLCMDISSDGDLVVTGSADKNLKIWGLDFGDCHKSLFAHSDSVMAVRFVHNTHYMFSAGKDRLLKYWDADKFELLQILEGHHADIWCLAVSARGDYVVTGSHDRSIRRWDRTEESLFIEEEKEGRLEAILEADIENTFENKYAPSNELSEIGVAALPGNKARETLTATDIVIDALEVAQEAALMIENKDGKIGGYAADIQKIVIMHGLSPSDYVLHKLSSIHVNDIEQALLALPFSDSLKLFFYLKDWSIYIDKVELVCRVATVLLQAHYNQLVCSPGARPILVALREVMHDRVKACKNTIGFNLAAMNHIKQLMASGSDALFKEAKMKLQQLRLKQSRSLERVADTVSKKRRKKQKDASQRNMT